MSINLSLTRHSYYRIRFRVSKSLVPYFKKEYINKSFSTRDKRIAQLQANKLYESYQSIIHAKYFTSQEQIQALVDEFIKIHLEQDILSSFTIDTTRYIAVENIITISESYKKFCKWYEQQNITDKQYMATTNKLSKLILPFLGLDTNIVDVTLDTIEELQEFLSTFPNISLKRYKHLTYNELIRLKDVPTSDMISVSTQIKYLKIVKQFFNYLVKANMLRYNPCTLLTMPNSRIAKREPFSKDEMGELFSLFDTLDDKKYIYYALAFTGIRPSELWKAKIESDGDIIYLNLTDDNLSLKTSSSYRKVPFHHKLISLGVDRKLKEVLNKYTQTQISIYFNKTIKPKIIEDSTKIMYCFRHTVATELKRANVNMDKVSEILGHSYDSNSITKEVYASNFTLEQLHEAINALAF